MKPAIWKSIFQYLWRIAFIALLNFMVLLMLAR